MIVCLCVCSVMDCHCGDPEQEGMITMNERFFRAAVRHAMMVCTDLKMKNELFLIFLCSGPLFNRRRMGNGALRVGEGMQQRTSCQDSTPSRLRQGRAASVENSASCLSSCCASLCHVFPRPGRTQPNAWCKRQCDPCNQAAICHGSAVQFWCSCVHFGSFGSEPKSTSSAVLATVFIPGVLGNTVLPRTHQ